MSASVMSPKDKALKALTIFLARGYEALDARARIGAEGEERFLAKLAEREAAFRNLCVYAADLAKRGTQLASDAEARELLSEAEVQTAKLVATARDALDATQACIAKLDSVRNATRAFHSQYTGAPAPRFIKGC